MTIGMRADFKNFFFDRPHIQRQLDAKERRKLSAIGARVRRSARSSIRKRKRRPAAARRGRRGAERSEPGRPPLSWQQSEPNLRTILFTYDPKRRSVTIGFQLLNQRPRGSSADSVPELLELGGTTTIIESRYRDRGMPWHPGAWRSGPVEHRRRVVRIRRRPSLGPARDANRSFIAQQFESQ